MVNAKIFIFCCVPLIFSNTLHTVLQLLFPTDCLRLQSLQKNCTKDYLLFLFTKSNFLDNSNFNYSGYKSQFCMTTTNFVQLQ